MDEQLKSNLTSGEHWTRFIYMLLFGLFLYIATLLAAVLVVAQFLFALITGAPNARLRQFGGEVVVYINQVWMFLTYNSEEKAFPFDDWPHMEVDEPIPSEPPAAPEPASTVAEEPPVVVDEVAEAPYSEPAPAEAPAKKTAASSTPPEAEVTAEVGEPEPSSAGDEKPVKTD